jgi:hypothetical protein
MEQPPRRVLRAASYLGILVLAFWHAMAVVLTNSPPNALRHELAPLLRRYAGPYVAQNWSIFAPNPPEANVHILVRGRGPSSQITGWYDATAFFLQILHRNRLSPLRELGEGLAHAANDASSGSFSDEDRAIIERTCSMVIDLYQKHHVREEQMEIDLFAIPAQRGEASVVRAIRWPWVAAPKVLYAGLF